MYLFIPVYSNRYGLSKNQGVYRSQGSYVPWVRDNICEIVGTVVLLVSKLRITCPTKI